MSCQLLDPASWPPTTVRGLLKSGQPAAKSGQGALSRLMPTNPGQAVTGLQLVTVLLLLGELIDLFSSY